MDKLFLIDAYAIIYRSYYAFINHPRINSKGTNTSAAFGFCLTLHEVMSKERPTHIGVAFDSRVPTFRREAYPQYKAQREATPEDIHASVPVIESLLKAMNIPVYQLDGYEADDIIGTLALKAGVKGIPTYMLTPDKDYGQLVRNNVFMYRPRHGGGYETLDPAGVEAKYSIANPQQMIDLLGLMGDASDNVPGCPGVGEKTAAKLLKQFGSIDSLLERTGELKGALKTKIENNKDKIRLSKFLVTIKTDVPIDLDLESMRVRQPNEAELRRVLDELEFKTLANKLLNKGENKPRAAAKDLFFSAEFAGEDTEAAKKGPPLSAETVVNECKRVDNVHDMSRLCDFFLTKEKIVLGVETSSSAIIDAKITCLGFAVEEQQSYYIPLPGDDVEARKIVNIFKPLYENAKIKKGGHDLKRLIEALQRYGVTLSGDMFDTMIAHYLIQPELSHDIGYLSEAYLKHTRKGTPLPLPDASTTPPAGQKDATKPAETYAAEDANICLRLIDAFIQELEKGGLTSLFRNIEMPLVPVLADMELTGVRIDTDSLKQTSAILTDRMHALEEQIYQLAGETFNIASPKQVGDILFGKLKIVEKPKKTKTGQYVTNEEVLQQLKSKSPIVEAILSHRGLKKLLGTYVDNLPKLINAKTGHIHTTFNQTVTATGRLSSSDPNLQNIPVRGADGKEIRRAFVPEPGCLFFSADYSQIELRVMAHLSGDENMKQAFVEGHDIHAATAARIYKKAIGDVTRDERTKAKRANFGIIYGITVFGLAERLGITRQEAHQLIDDYFATFPSVHSYMDYSVETARRRGYVETLFGRRRYLPDINSRNATVRQYAERNAINAPIQGTAADIIKVAMVRISRRFKAEQLRSKMILQVHDELIFSVIPEERDIVERIVLTEMEGACPLSVPLVADCAYGSNWLEAH